MGFHQKIEFVLLKIAPVCPKLGKLCLSLVFGTKNTLEENILFN